MSDIVIGGMVTLSVAFIIAVVTLAFKNSDAYWKLAKVLLALLMIGLVFYGGYGVGSLDGGRWAVRQIENGAAVADIDTSLSSWPILIILAVGYVIIVLSFLPQYLGIETAKKPKGNED